MYLNVVQLAESFGVDERVVESWVRDENLPCVHDRGRMLFDRAQVVTWAAGRGRAAKAGFLAPARPASDPGWNLESMLRHGGIWREVNAADVLNVLERIVDALPGASPAVRRLLVQRLHAPGGVTWAPVGNGFALPHLRSAVALGRNSGTFALIFLRDALRLDEALTDRTPVTRLLFFIAPSPRAHLDLLAQLSRALAHGHLRQLVLEAAPDADLYAAMAGAESAAVQLKGPETKP